MQDTATNLSIAMVLANQLVVPVYQPIVDLATQEVVGYEALARGPRGSQLETPAALFAAADRAGLGAELDWECRAAAVRGAVAAGLGRESCLFLNLEASTFGIECPDHLTPGLLAGTAQLNVMAEITERDLAADPAALVYELGDLRRHGFGIAVDDLGANVESLAMLPFLRPDVIKLDMDLIQSATSEENAATTAAVRSDAERRGTLIVAEGIENEEHLERAHMLGATHGQGWFFAPPGPLPLERRRVGPMSSFWERLGREFHPPPRTPWSLVDGSANVQITTKRRLLPISMAIEQHPVTRFEQPVVLSAFQHADNFTAATATRYAELSRSATFVGVLGVGLSAEPVPGVRGGSIAEDHELAGEWTVTRVGPHYAAALIAFDLGDSGPESERRFKYVVTHDRDTVVSAATSLLRLISPV